MIDSVSGVDRYGRDRDLCFKNRAESFRHVTEMVERDTSADMIDSTVVRAHHCAVGLKRGIKRPRGLAGRAAASPPSSTPAATDTVGRSALS